MSPDYLSDGTPILWMACDCYIWPMGYPQGRCGRCGVAVHRFVDKPVGGKARPLSCAEILAAEL